ncbi:MAG: DUF1292 domain-containing protein [Clostridia bacterium]|jgi:uncharacterized protein YrzB (UPF0473 family)|nr:DUF1292 domain-containing protein [Clostridia bacterium]MBQ2462768.1 DUF1292 domain-containing protein [Clostridia bacterium]MBR0216880.1 DUF1292 domain-containing protein [Clostridia bacterium]
MSDMELNNNMDELEDAEDLGPITLVDENNEEHQFELIDTVKYEEDTYAVMAPYGDIDDESDDEINLVILRMVEEGDEISLETVADEDLLDAVYAAFQEANPDLFEEE